ncbi:hypothetical protein Syun_027906 [Stephania yunnanensis]|uniref:Uncharacterized protein n=1 Tax=Stephania yunnanensis TaxID=152371 RepID=A0AAP0EGE1_9MAGN
MDTRDLGGYSRVSGTYLEASAGHFKGVGVGELGGKFVGRQVKCAGDVACLTECRPFDEQGQGQGQGGTGRLPLRFCCTFFKLHWGAKRLKNTSGCITPVFYAVNESKRPGKNWTSRVMRVRLWIVRVRERSSMKSRAAEVASPLELVLDVA